MKTPLIVEWRQGCVSDVPKEGLTKDVLGGKGWGLANMCMNDLPVPPGFTLTTTLFHQYRERPAATMDEIRQMLPPFLASIEKQFGYMPLFSARSGAPVSMPGMMDTVLNLGLSSATLSGWRKRLGDRAAFDSYRRLFRMYGETVLGLPKAEFDRVQQKSFQQWGYKTEADATYGKLWILQERFGKVIEKAEMKVPMTLTDQLCGAIEAVFKSWDSERAIEYRKLYGISDDMGTACNVQAMVFGNAGETSGTGVLFTRDPSTGERRVTGEFLVNAQGEDVVAGTHTPIPFTGYNAFGDAKIGESTGLDHLPTILVEPVLQAMELGLKLEADAKDAQDIEFTIQDGKLWVLQTRNMKRTAAAAFKIAADMAFDGTWTLSECAKKITATQFMASMKPRLDRNATIAKLGQPIAKGYAASPGVAIGRVVIGSSSQWDQIDGPRILVAKETNPEDFPRMVQSVGILTAMGGFTSHAAVVARGMDKPCVTACTALVFGGQQPTLNGEMLPSGEWMTIDATTGDIWLGQGVLEASSADEALAFLNEVMGDKKVRLRSDKPLQGGHIVAAAAIEAGTVVEWVAEIAKAQVANAILDLRLADAWLAKEDMAFLGFTRPSNKRLEGEVTLAVKMLEQAKLKGCSVILPLGISDERVQGLEKAGYTIVPTVYSLTEAAKVGGPVFLGASIEQAIGPDLMAAVLKHLQGEGFSIATVSSMTLGEAATALLG